MADKKLNAVSTASDGAYVYAEDANGNQIKISKADLASVVAELIGTATTSKRGLMPSRLVPVDDTSGVTSINLNTSKSIGRVYAGLRTIFSNYPTGLTYPYMGAFNLGYTSNGQLIQFLFSNDDSGNYAVHHRCCHAGNNWTEWKKLL